MKRLFLTLLISFPLSHFAQVTPFEKGVNLTNWFQAGNVRQVQPNKYTLTDFEQIQSLGCDVIRLPINLHFMTNGAPDYTIDPLLFDFLDPVVEWADSLGMHLILDNHTFDPIANTDPNVGDILDKVWLQMASHYANGYENLYYEILNEPHGISDALWGSIQGDVIDVIRTVDTSHTLIVGGSGYNSLYNLNAIPTYADQNLIYTFHFYDPFIFTHQGATWGDPSMAPLANVPFPYDASKMPPFPSALNGTWIQGAFNNYAADGTVQKLNDHIDVVENFRNARNVPVFCGEFGVFIPNSDPIDRNQWYQEVRNIFDSRYMSWTIWDYEGGFGIYDLAGNGQFEHDLNTDLLAALGFNVPPQTPFIAMPDSVGFLIYDDALGEDITESSNSNGPIDYYAADYPNSGNYTLKWTGPSQYNAIGMDFSPNKDLSYLEAQGYALDMMVRGDQPTIEFDIRFLDTKTTDPNDHPWRIRVTLDNQDAAWDSKWHHVHLPLSSFTEHGSWDNNMWFQPEGKFDWTKIDRLEIVAEHKDMLNSTLWFDQIWVTNQDTAMVREDGAVSIFNAMVHEPTSILLFPNPTLDQLSLKPLKAGSYFCEVLDVQGRIIEQVAFSGETILETSAWPNGLYLLKLREEGGIPLVKRVLKM